MSMCAYPYTQPLYRIMILLEPRNFFAPSASHHSLLEPDFVTSPALMECTIRTLDSADLNEANQGAGFVATSMSGFGATGSIFGNK